MHALKLNLVAIFVQSVLNSTPQKPLLDSSEMLDKIEKKQRAEDLARSIADPNTYIISARPYFNGFAETEKEPNLVVVGLPPARPYLDTPLLHGHSNPPIIALSNYSKRLS